MSSDTEVDVTLSDKAWDVRCGEKDTSKIILDWNEGRVFWNRTEQFCGLEQDIRPIERASGTECPLLKLNELGFGMQVAQTTNQQGLSCIFHTVYLGIKPVNPYVLLITSSRYLSSGLQTINDHRESQRLKRKVSIAMACDWG